MDSNEEIVDSFLLGDRISNKKPLTEQQQLENAASILSKNSSKNSFKNITTGNVPNPIASSAMTSTPLVLNRKNLENTDMNNNSKSNKLTKLVQNYSDKYQPRWTLLQKLKDSKPLIFDVDPPNGKKMHGFCVFA